MKTVLLLLICIILLNGIGTFAADPQEMPDPLPQEEQTTPTAVPTGQKEPEEPTFNLPSILFKGKVLKRKDIGTFDQIFINGKEAVSDKITIETIGRVEIKIIKDNNTYTYSIYSINGILTLVPPLVAILMALIFRDVVIALFIGIFTGALFINFNLSDFVAAFFTAFFNVVDKYALKAIIDKDNASIIVFTLLL
ncbi:MAG: hypothetical protein JSV88_09920, partial [Candidatus Aminicenantes bacterium]